MEEQIQKLLNDHIDEQTVACLSPLNIEKVHEEIKAFNNNKNEEFVENEIKEIKIMGQEFVDKIYDYNKKEFQKKIVKSLVDSNGISNNNYDKHYVELFFCACDGYDIFNIYSNYKNNFRSHPLCRKLIYRLDPFTGHLISNKLNLTYETFSKWEINDMLSFFGYDKQVTINETVEFLKNIGWLAIAFPQKYSCKIYIINPNPKSVIKITVGYRDGNETKNEWIDRMDELLTNKKKEFDSYGLVLNYELPKTILFWTLGTINITISKK